MKSLIATRTGTTRRERRMFEGKERAARFNEYELGAGIWCCATTFCFSFSLVVVLYWSFCAYRHIVELYNGNQRARLLWVQ